MWARIKAIGSRLGQGRPQRFDLAKLAQGTRPESVLIVGAGAAGLACGYFLHQLDIPFRILEAQPVLGGRMRDNRTLADVPLPLGAEWLNTEAPFLADLVGVQNQPADVALGGYRITDTYGRVSNGKVSMSRMGYFDYQVFRDGSWLTFFEQHIAPRVLPHITFGAVVQEVAYQNGQAEVHLQDGTCHAADNVIVTAPVGVLQAGDIVFRPALPEAKHAALRAVQVWDGIKVFITFAERFYPTFLDFEVRPEGCGEKSYYDAAYGKPTTTHILGLFAVGQHAEPYLACDEGDLVTLILSELDSLFDGQASAHYVDYAVQDWRQEPFAKGAYVQNEEHPDLLRTLAEPVADTVYFAGDAYTAGDDWGFVHTAVTSAYAALEHMMAPSTCR